MHLWRSRTPRTDVRQQLGRDERIVDDRVAVVEEGGGAHRDQPRVARSCTHQIDSARPCGDHAAVTSRSERERSAPVAARILAARVRPRHQTEITYTVYTVIAAA